MQPSPIDLAQHITDLLAALPQVEAVALGGSRRSHGQAWDRFSDIDLYVYSRGDIPVEIRRDLVEQSGGATVANLDLRYWGLGDEWLHAPTGIEIDLVYFDAHWMEAQIARVVEQHLASLGYSTCFWHTVRQSQGLYDREDWFATLQQKCKVEYPEALRRNVIELNHPVLRRIIPSYVGQIEKAVRRADIVSLNHRLTALLASYFDILFAFNRQLHPGEKRLIELAMTCCPELPVDIAEDITAVLSAASADIPDLPVRVTRLLDRLDQLLEGEGFGFKESL